MIFCKQCFGAMQPRLRRVQSDSNNNNNGGGARKELCLLCLSCGVEEAMRAVEDRDAHTGAASRVFTREILVQITSGTRANAGAAPADCGADLLRLDPTLLRVSNETFAESEAAADGPQPPLPRNAAAEALRAAHSSQQQRVLCPHCAHTSMIVSRSNSGAFDFQRAFHCPSCAATFSHLPGP